jgi:hypothetical protein
MFTRIVIRGVDVSFFQFLFLSERVTGIEPARSPWEGEILPLNHTRILPST